MEGKFGAVIFDRSASPLELTQAGQVFIEYIESVAQCEDTLNEKLWDIQNQVKGTVRLGGSNYALSSIVPLILRQVMPRYPGIQIDLIEEKSFSLRRMVQDRELDLVIDSFDMEDDTLVYHHLLNEQILLAVPDSGEENLKDCQITRDMIRQNRRPAAALPPEEICRLLEKPFILLKPENDMFHRAQKIFVQYNVSPRVLLQLDQLITSLQYMESGLGCSFVTDTLFRYGDHGKQLCLYPIGEGETPYRKLCVVHKKGKYISNPCKLLTQTAQQVFGSHEMLLDGSTVHNTDEIR